MPASWKPEVFVHGGWHSNQLRFATEQEAAFYAAHLFSRWTQTEDHRPAESDDPVTAEWTTDGKLRINDFGAAEPAADTEGGT